MDSKSDLAKLLTPTLYATILQSQLPWPRDKPLNFQSVATHYFAGEHLRAPALKQEWYPALKSLSLFPLSEALALNLFDNYLPSPEDPQFAEQAFALQVLLDQGPRILFGNDSVDARWIGFFDVLSLELARRFLELPEGLRPWSRKRWGDAVSFDYWVCLHLWFLAPLVHSESRKLHAIASQMTEEYRRDVERESGETDPYRATRAERDGDVFAFPKMLREGGPGAGKKELRMEEFMFWLLTVLDVHGPIIERFGRYPYRNGAQGREWTEEERKWISDVGGFGAVDPEVARRIRQDVEKGVWTPLGEGKE